MCGIVGEVYFQYSEDRKKYPQVAEMIAGLLLAIQHRGHESAGITVTDGANVSTKKGFGSVQEAFSGEKEWLRDHSGLAGIGHVRYSTTGSGIPPKLRGKKLTREEEKKYIGARNIQPFFLEPETWPGKMSLVHNGNLTNADQLKKFLHDKGIVFTATSDTEVIVRLIAFYAKRCKNIPLAIKKAMRKMQGAYSCLFLTREGIWAFRDPLGFRPLKIAKTKEGYIFASEPCAWHGLDAKFLRNIKPGEIVEAKIGRKCLASYRVPRKNKRAFCIFEDVYLQAIYNERVAEIRMQMGKFLFKAASDEFAAKGLNFKPGIVIPVMNSGEGAALGFHYAQSDFYPGESHYYPAIYRDPNVGRTFLEPKQIDRISKNKRKYHKLFKPISKTIKRIAKKEKEIWLYFIDDSLIRANVARTLIKKIIRPELKKLFPRLHYRIKIAWLLSSPPYQYPCYFGIDTYERSQLVAANMSIPEIAKHIGADHIVYLPLDYMLKAAAKFHNLKKCDFCHACFSGKYPVPINPAQDKLVLAA
jgi:amidophosphoribosyltransferase